MTNEWPVRLPSRPGAGGLWATAVVCAAALLPARAGSADVISIAGAHIDPRSSSGPLTVTEIGGQPVNRPQEGTAVQSLPANTLLVSYEHYWNEQLATQLVLGLPPTHQLRGTGTLAPFGVLGEGQQWSPTVIMKWHFLDAAQALRPYLGLGLNYTWYRRSRITNEAFVDAAFGPDATTSSSASPSWNLVYNAGADYRLDEHWSIGVSLAYTPLKTRLRVQAQDTMYGVPVVVNTDLQLRSLTGAVNLAYRF